MTVDRCIGSSVFAAAIIVIAVIAGITGARAHKSETGQDYSKFLQPNGNSCCNDTDCRPVRYEYRLGELIMFPEGQPVVIPADRLNQRRSDDGRAHWCGIVHKSGTPTTFCAILPMQAVENAPVPGRGRTLRSANASPPLEPAPRDLTPAVRDLATPVIWPDGIQQVMCRAPAE